MSRMKTEEVVVWYENTEEHRKQNLVNNQIVWCKVKDIPDPALAIYNALVDKFYISSGLNVLWGVEWFTSPVAPNTSSLPKYE